MHPIAEENVMRVKNKKGKKKKKKEKRIADGEQLNFALLGSTSIRTEPGI